MHDRAHRRTLWLFTLLAVYVVAQFVWWAVLLLRRDEQLARMALELEAHGGPSVGDGPFIRGTRMVLGEGLVLLVLLLAGLIITLRAIRRDLRSARTQRNFLLAVTHELRSPIAAIKLQLQTLDRAGLSPEQREHLHRQALEEADRLALLTDKVLLATRADAGPVPIALSTTDVVGLVRNVAERTVEAAGGTHQLHCTGTAPLLAETDADALRSIVGNLVENACKYAPAGTTVEVAVEEGRDGWRLMVHDEGPGIPPGERGRIFELLYRAGNEESRRAPGTGLGLYIVHRLVHHLGGQVQFRERAPRGSTFVASFPSSR